MAQIANKANFSANKPLATYAAIYERIKDNTLEQIETFGLPLSSRNTEEESANKLDELSLKGALVRNTGKSIVSNGRISSACEACKTGTGSYTSFISLKCHRDCYFCFNKNQDDYSFYVQNQKNVNAELETLVSQGVELTHLALTGGEPLLHPDETLSFFRKAQLLVPEAHTRLYTAGDLLNEEILLGLKDAGLKEIRFSIKMEDSVQKQKHILGKIRLAKKYIPDVLVEMPVIPGTGEEMKELLIELDQIGIFGINLLEFCFPLENAEAFREKGFTLKNPPYQVYYSFWYAGGLAVDGSEALCHELVEFAIDQQLSLGVHYCSLENKFTGQIYQQNRNENPGSTYRFSTQDFYFKTAKVFGRDRNKVRKILRNHQFPVVEDEHYDFLQFPLDAIPFLKSREVEIAISSNVVEDGAIREVGITVLKPQDYSMQGKEQ
ncbi:radical SAM protein [Bacillus sp. B-jedd]|uniref:radical SAM protein n=1 Tax=Bacillus sp. B-jedd TaxID=1476857 RepID=UPI0005155901|nr:radical SAM protein [Bacillus sp. B-jedd]CEG26541.1 radical SAM domain-containing protein [Bacillus sp. B-jedd]